MKMWLKVLIGFLLVITILGFFIALFFSPSDCAYTAFCRCNNTAVINSNASNNSEDASVNSPHKSIGEGVFDKIFNKSSDAGLKEKKSCDNLIGCKDYVFTLGIFNVYSNDKGKEVVICQNGTSVKFSKKIDYWSGGMNLELWKFPKFRIFNTAKMLFSYSLRL